MSHLHRFTFLFLLIFILPCKNLVAQREDPLNQDVGSSSQDTIPEGVMPLDTPVPMTYVLMENPDVKYSFTDSYQWEDYSHYPLAFYHAHLGNYGSAARSLIPTVDDRIGFSTGWIQYEPYHMNVEQFRYYNQDVPVSKIKYSQAGQEDTYISLDFGRSFAHGFNLSIAYERINQVGEFDHQRQKDSGLSVGLWYDDPRGKYDAFYNYLSNSIVTEENGGIIPAFTDSIGTPHNPDESIPTFIQSGLTNHKHRSFLTKQILHVLADTSSFGMDLWLQAQYSTGLYKYVDEDASSVSDYYPPAYLVDDRGIRQYTYEIERQFTFGLSLPWHAAHSTLHSSLRYRSVTLEQEPVKRNINEIYLDVAGDFQWVEAFKLNGQLSLGLGQAEGNLTFRGEGDLQTGILGHLLGYWAVTTRQPYLVESSLYVTHQQVYQTHFKNPFINEIGVTWEIQKHKLQAGIKWILFDNFIYFDAVAFPQQLDESFSLQRYFLGKEFDFKWFGLKGDVVWQPDAREELAIPSWIYTISVNSRIKIFDKKVTLVPGLDLTYHDGFTGISYFPVNGTYHLTDGPAIPDYLRIDAGFGLQVSFIKAFVRMEDLEGLFKDRVLYQADLYPHYRGYFRFGIAAGFYN